MLQLKKLYTEAKKIEKDFNLELLKEFIQLVKENKEAGEIIPSHLINNCINLKTFYPIIVILERELNKESVETDFLVTTKDLEIKKQTHDIYFLLENIRSSFNVGSIFRTADSLGVKEVLLTGYTSTPENPKTLKTSLGASTQTKWSHFLNPLDAIKELKDKNINIYALETSKKAKMLGEFKPSLPFCLVVGNERFGLSKDLLAKCDEIICIPQFGIKNSLNVSVSIGVAGYQLLLSN